MQDDIGTLIEPQPVQFSWGAPGWYVLAGLVLVFVLVIVAMIVRHYRKNKYRREALLWLASREREINKQHPDQIVYDATMLMKRIAISRYGREHAAIREGEWITFLNNACKSPLFSDTDSAWLTQALYASGSDIASTDVQNYLNKTKVWIKRHRYAL
ncbi:MAG: DUF4381 domain-containing protein [Chryseolinea sp.]